MYSARWSGSQLREGHSTVSLHLRQSAELSVASPLLRLLHPCQPPPTPQWPVCGPQPDSCRQSEVECEFLSLDAVRRHSGLPINVFVLVFPLILFCFCREPSAAGTSRADSCCRSHQDKWTLRKALRREDRWRTVNGVNMTVRPHCPLGQIKLMIVIVTSLSRHAAISGHTTH